ncbi:MAG: redoxin domain-containing protein, partial [Planctomycetales bacterium]|nr:redoxin domain-containing protein [Planctomycetales bacterium]
PLQPGALQPLEVGEASRVFISSRPPSPPLRYEDFKGADVEAPLGKGRPTLVNVWASWCRPCLEELAAWRNAHQQFEERGLNIVALSVDAIDENADAGVEQAKQTVERLRLPFASGMLTAETYRRVEQLFDWPFGRRVPLPAPTSLLFDGQGQLAAIYRGPAEVDAILADLSAVETPADARLEEALPFPGRWLGRPRPQRPIQIAIGLMNKGDVADAADFVRRNKELLYPHKEFVLLVVWLGDEFSKRNMTRDALQFYAQAVQRDPANLTLMNNLAWQLAANRNADVRNPREAVRWAERAAAATGFKHTGVLDTLAVAYASAKRFDDAVRIADQARKIAAEEGDDATVLQMESRLRQFREGQPYRDE